ncbi:MAG: DNA-binding protein [Bacteroidota bacterium]
MSGDEKSPRPLEIIWGAEAIAKTIGLNRRQTYRLLERGALKGASKIGSKYFITREALIQNFREAVRE